MNFEDIASVTDSGNDAFTAPERITVGDSGGIASSYPLQMTPRTDIPDADSGRADDGAVSPDEPEESPFAAEDSRPPAERLTCYAGCHYKLIPAGTDVDSVNRTFIYSLRYGREWGFSTVMLPVSDALADGLCLDADGRPLGEECLRQTRRDAVECLQSLGDNGEIDALYDRKLSVILRGNIRADDFENAPVTGPAINCFSSFVSNKATTCDILMLQVPVSDPWNVFAWIPCGGLGKAPSNELLTIASRRWYDLCGAVPAVLGYGEIEYFVPNGLPSRETAARIARDQFALCHERVLRLSRSHTLGELTDTLTKSCVWYLGWK